MRKYDTSPKRCKNFKQCGVTMTFPHIKNESAEMFWRRGSCSKRCQVARSKRWSHHSVLGIGRGT